MAVIIPAGYGVMSVHTRTALDAEQMIWTCGMDMTSWAPDGDFPQVAADAWEEHFAPITSTIVTLEEVKLRIGPTPTGPTYSAVVSTPGTQTSALLPPNCAVLVQKRTLLGGRANRGRMYLPGISLIAATLDSGGNFSSGQAEAIQDAVDAFFAELVDVPVFGTARPVLLHSASSDPTPITGFTVPTKIATQRRRLRP